MPRRLAGAPLPRRSAGSSSSRRCCSPRAIARSSRIFGSLASSWVCAPYSWRSSACSEQGTGDDLVATRASSPTVTNLVVSVLLGSGRLPNGSPVGDPCSGPFAPSAYDPWERERVTAQAHRRSDATRTIVAVGAACGFVYLGVLAVRSAPLSWLAYAVIAVAAPAVLGANRFQLRHADHSAGRFGAAGGLIIGSLVGLLFAAGQLVSPSPQPRPVSGRSTPKPPPSS